MAGLSPNLRLLVEPVGDAHDEPRDTSALVDVPVGRGVRTLDVERFAAQPRLGAARGKASARALRFEAVNFEGRPALLMLVPPGIPVRVNGQPAPRIAVLGVGDQVQLDDAVLHVSRRREPRAAAPSPELLGRLCGVCRVALTVDTQILVHDCGTALHLEADSKPEAERLQCALLGNCPVCEDAVSLEAGLVFEPEL
jgi:hypothetical protein